MAATKQEFDALVDPIIKKFGDEVYGVCMMVDFYVRAGRMCSSEINNKYVGTLGTVMYDWARSKGVDPSKLNECQAEVQKAMQTFAIIDQIPD